MREEEAREKYGSTLARPVCASADSVLVELEQGARRRAQDTVTSIFLRADALALADLLAGQPLADAEEAHAPFRQVVEAADKAVVEARNSWKVQTMELMRQHRPQDGTQIPSADSAPVDRAWQALKDAQSSADQTGRHLRSLREKIERLRAIPEPDPADVALLARVIGAAEQKERRP
jgi:hypothetical protein